MIKETIQDPYIIGALLASVAWFLTKIMWPIVGSKIDHKDLKIQESAMKDWVQEFLKDALKEFKVALGDFYTDKARALAHLIKNYGANELRFTLRQDILIRNIKEENLPTKENVGARHVAGRCGASMH